MTYHGCVTAIHKAEGENTENRGSPPRHEASSYPMQMQNDAEGEKGRKCRWKEEMKEVNKREMKKEK